MRYHSRMFRSTPIRQRLRCTASAAVRCVLLLFLTSCSKLTAPMESSPTHGSAERVPAPASPTLRVATFNVAMGLSAPGEPGADWVTFSDHRLVWLDVSW